jgi:hypothetical protein
MQVVATVQTQPTINRSQPDFDRLYVDKKTKEVRVRDVNYFLYALDPSSSSFSAPLAGSYIPKKVLESKLAKINETRPDYHSKVMDNLIKEGFVKLNDRGQFVVGPNVKDGILVVSHDAPEELLRHERIHRSYFSDPKYQKVANSEVLTESSEARATAFIYLHSQAYDNVSFNPQDKEGFKTFLTEYDAYKKTDKVFKEMVEAKNFTTSNDLSFSNKVDKIESALNDALNKSRDRIGEVDAVKVRKEGDAALLEINGKTYLLREKNGEIDTMFVGKVSLSQVDIVKENNKISALRIRNESDKKNEEYYLSADGRYSMKLYKLNDGSQAIQISKRVEGVDDPLLNSSVQKISRDENGNIKNFEGIVSSRGSKINYGEAISLDINNLGAVEPPKQKHGLFGKLKFS